MESLICPHIDCLAFQYFRDNIHNIDGVQHNESGIISPIKRVSSQPKFEGSYLCIARSEYNDSLVGGSQRPELGLPECSHIRILNLLARLVDASQIRFA
jgi:hypothetical protein